MNNRTVAISGAPDFRSLMNSPLIYHDWKISRRAGFLGDSCERAPAENEDYRFTAAGGNRARLRKLIFAKATYIAKHTRADRGKMGKRGVQVRARAQ